MASSVSAATSIPAQDISGKKSLFYPTQKFYKLVNADGCSNFLSVVKKVLNIAFLIIIPLNLMMIPFIAAWNCCQSGGEKKTATVLTTDASATTTTHAPATEDDHTVPTTIASSPVVTKIEHTPPPAKSFLGGLLGWI